MKSPRYKQILEYVETHPNSTSRQIDLALGLGTIIHGTLTVLTRRKLVTRVRVFDGGRFPNVGMWAYSAAGSKEKPPTQ